MPSITVDSTEQPELFAAAALLTPLPPEALELVRLLTIEQLLMATRTKDENLYEGIRRVRGDIRRQLDIVRDGLIGRSAGEG